VFEELGLHKVQQERVPRIKDMQVEQVTIQGVIQNLMAVVVEQLM
jgi:hypothetical protein